MELRHFTSVHSLAQYDFNNNNNLECVDCQNITSTGAYFAKSCPKIHLYFKNIVTLSSSAFFDFNGILIEIGDKCTNLKRSSMYGSVQRLVCHATTPPTVASDDNYSFSRTIAGIYVPDESVDDYKAAFAWSRKASRIYPLSSYPYPDELLYLEH